MTCHLFLDNFSWNFMTFALFSKVKSFETDFCFKKLQISQLWYHEMFIFSESLSFAKDMLSQKVDCVFVLAICGLLHMTKNLSCGVILCFNHCYGIFWKVSLKKSWCCRKHVFVFEIVSLKGLNKFLIKLSFSLWLLGKRFVRHYGRSLKTFPFWELTFLLYKKVKLLNFLEGDFEVEPLKRS